MYKSLFYLFFVVSLLNIEAQGQVFRIDSIPEEGILLNKGWKFHAGDNPDFAKPDFDDSKWESIDPTMDFMDLPQTHNGIMWLRIHFFITSTNDKNGLALLIRQIGASEFYLNGACFNKFGVVDENQTKAKAFQPWWHPVYLPLTNNGKQIFAIRYNLQKGIPYTRYATGSNPLLRIWLNKVDYVNDNSEFKIFNYTLKHAYLKIGFFLILFILHFALYFFYPKQKANFYFGLYALAQFLQFLLESFSRTTSNTELSFYLLWIQFFLNLSLVFSALESIYLIFQQPKDWRYRAILILSIPTIFITYFYYKIGPWISILFSLFGLAEIIRISYISKTNKKTFSILIVYCVIICIILIIIGNFLFSFGYNYISLIYIRMFIFVTSQLIIPLAISIFLANEFGFKSKGFELKLREVQQLSLEKQETLQRQNAELQAALLQGQTIERKRVAADLHDNLGSTMSSLIWTMEAIDANKLQPEEKDVYQSLKSMLSKAYDEVRMLSHNLLPEEFEKQGLTAALQYFVRKVNQNSSIKFDLHIDETLGKLDKKVEFELYSICLELVNNIIKHSKATKAKIEISKTENQLKLTVEDDGIGIFENNSDGKGMRNVRARVESLNGVWNMQNIENQGVLNEIVITV